MQLSQFLVTILVGFVINIQCVPLLQNSDSTQNEFIRSPEYNERFAGGDMILPPPLSLKERGVGVRPASYHRWKSGVIPYEFASNISANHTIFIETQMRAMENLTQVNNTQCIQFRPKNATDQFFITIFNGSGCYAPVGSWGNSVSVRPVSFMHTPTSTCMVSGIIQHELAHVLGFYHEQSRPDRDSYVTINWANINPAQASNFDKYNDSEVDTQGTPYDYGSVMHYERTAFAINSSGVVITPTQNTSAFIGQRIRLSPIDILEIQRYYGCVPTPPSTTTLPSSTSAGASSSSTSAGVSSSSTSAGPSSSSTGAGASSPSTSAGASSSSTSAGASSSSTSAGASSSSTSAGASSSSTSAGASSSSTSAGVTSPTTTGATPSPSNSTDIAAAEDSGADNTIQSHLGIYLVCLASIIYFSTNIH